MPDTWAFNDFSAGWIPTEDAINGRKNGFLRFQNCELDQLGAVVLSQPARNAISPSALPTDAHTLFSKFVGSSRLRYSGLTDGKLLRNNFPVITGGSTTRAAFGIAFNFTIIASGSKRIKDDGTNTYNLGILRPTVAPVVVLGAAGNLNGDYQYAQINVFNSGAYVGKSPKSDSSAVLTVTNQQTTVTPQDPSGTDPQCNEAWIFRRGGKLDQFYFVKKLTTTTGFGPFADNLSDQDALTLNIKLIETATSVGASGIPDDILEIVGPINGRHLYFTATQIYFSEINSPDSYDSRATMNISSNKAEQFLWARWVADNVVLIGTTHTVYALTGNYIQFPDGFMDVYLRSTGTDTPPLHIDAAVHEGNVVYMSAFGWVSMGPNGVPQMLTSGSVERLYRGETCNGYFGVPIYEYPNGGTNVRYPCVLSRNKLWVVVPTVDPANSAPANFGRRMDVYDFTRQYWRTTQFVPNNLCCEEDDTVYGYFPADKFIRDFDLWVSQGKLIDGTTKQSLDLLTPFFDFNFPRNRKDLYTIKLKINTNGDPVTILCYINDDKDRVTPISLGTISTTTLQEVDIDTSQIFTDMAPGMGNPIKNIMISLTGSVGDFQLNYISFEFDTRPIQLTSLKVGPIQMGTSGRKRIAMIPFVMDTLGNTVTVSAYIDNVFHSSKTFVSTYKKVHEYYFNPIGVGKNFELRAQCTTAIASPEIYIPCDLDTLCTEVCDEVLLAKYASGGACPNAEKIQLFQDDFSGYLDNNTPGAPGWQDTGTYGVFSSGSLNITKQTVGGTPTLRATVNVGIGAKARNLMFIGAVLTYPSWDTTPCGVYLECTYAQVSGFVYDGNIENGMSLTIGLDNPGGGVTPANNYLDWRFQQGKLHLEAGESSSTLLATGIPAPVVGDTLRFQLYHLGSFGWKLECFINDVSKASSTNGVILLSNSRPKRLGITVRMGNNTGHTGSEDISNFRAGVF